MDKLSKLDLPVEFGRILLQIVLAGQFVWEVADAFLSEDAHVNLESKESENAEGEHSENDDIPEIFHRLDHGTNDGLQACEIVNKRNVNRPTWST